MSDAIKVELPESAVTESDRAVAWRAAAPEEQRRTGRGRPSWPEFICRERQLIKQIEKTRVAEEALQTAACECGEDDACALLNRAKAAEAELTSLRSSQAGLLVASRAFLHFLDREALREGVIGAAEGSPVGMMRAAILAAESIGKAPELGKTEKIEDALQGKTRKERS